MHSDDFNGCAELVQKGDDVRFRAAMASPVAARAVLFPLYALNVEVARAPWVTSEAMIAEMRLQWWYDVLEAIVQGEPVNRHSVATPLAEILTPAQAKDLQQMVEARRWDIYKDPFEDQTALETYIRDTSAVLVRVAAQRLDNNISDQGLEAVEQYGWAMGCANYLNAIPALLAQKRIPLVDGRPEGVAQLATLGLDSLSKARQKARFVTKAASPALLAGWDCEAVLKQAIQHPDRVIDGLAPVNPLASSLRLMWQATTHRY